MLSLNTFIVVIQVAYRYIGGGDLLKLAYNLYYHVYKRCNLLSLLFNLYYLDFLYRFTFYIVTNYKFDVICRIFNNIILTQYAIFFYLLYSQIDFLSINDFSIYYTVKYNYSFSIYYS